MMTMAQNAQTQAAMTPERALELLLDGNRRFREGRRAERDLLKQVESTRGGQWPYAIVLSCIDSRVSAELVFDAGIGDLFSIRIAGNFVNEDILGSIEFGCRVAGARLVVVMGHSHCGAIKGACDGVELEHLTGLLAKLQPAVEGVSTPDAEQRSSGNAAFVQEVATRNVELTLAAIRERSAILRELESDGSIQMAGAMYDVETGTVELLD